MKNKNKKLFITGGHITPAIAVIDELKKDHPEWEIILVGRNSLEERLAKEKNIGFRKYIHAFWYCVGEKPDCIVSFGSYVAVPVCIAAWALGIPIITHEQTHVPGRANRLIARMALRICVTFEETAGLFPKEKTVVTGLPMRKELFSPPEKSPFPIKEDRPIIYITGGSIGAESLNAILFSIIPKLISRYTVVHQTGLPSLAQAKDIHSPFYIARDFFDVQTVAWLFAHAQLVIGRSGANTVMELALLGKRAILVPLPWSAGGEQLANARWLENLGVAIVLEQPQITAQSLELAIEQEMDTPKILEVAPIPRDGAHRMAHEIDAILE